MKQTATVNDTNYFPQGFRYFNDNICGYGNCASTSSHYHCVGCGFAVNELEHVSSHRATCPAPNFSQSNNYSRSLDPPLYPPTAHHHTSPQGQECSYYSPMYSLQQTTGPPTLSPGAGSFYRTQPSVFSPYYNTNSLGYDSYGQGPEPWASLSRQSSLGSRDTERLPSCKESRSPKVPLPASSSCLYSQNYSSDLYSDSGLDSCFLSRPSQQQASTSRGSVSSSSSTNTNQKQLPSFEPSLGFIMGPEDGMYSPAPFSFHVGSDSFVDHKASPFSGVVEDLPGETCLGLPFPPVPPQQPPSCLLEPSAEDQDSDLGSDEHEIIVEETGDDQLITVKQACVVCAGQCGWAAVELRIDHPVTLSSHVPVWAKLTELLGVQLGARLEPGKTLCSKCLQLLHTVDQLQAQLADATQRFLVRLHQPVEQPIISDKQNTDMILVQKSNEPSKEALQIASEIEQKCTDIIATHPELKLQSLEPCLQCELCSRNFSSRKSLTTHMRRHVRRMSTPISYVICEVCGKQFSNRSNLSAHKPVCSGEFPLHCNMCGKGFALESKLHVHKATHQGQYPYKCEICHKGFIKQSDLNVHKRAHSGEKPFVCEVCGKRFANSGNYNHHSKLHTKERPFKCLICNKGFMRRSYLAAHVNRHNGSKPFTCDICNKAFPDRSNLHHHRKLHEGYKPYTCPICGKALSSGLQAHIRTHSGEKPFKCNICGQCFTANSSLNKHMKRHNTTS